MTRRVTREMARAWSREARQDLRREQKLSRDAKHVRHDARLLAYQRRRFERARAIHGGNGT